MRMNGRKEKALLCETAGREWHAQLCMYLTYVQLKLVIQTEFYVAAR